jgi:hypothetical protein
LIFSQAGFRSVFPEDSFDELKPIPLFIYPLIPS